MRCSIITPSFRQPDFLKSCLASVVDQTGVEVEHIVQDNLSGADVAAVCSAHPGIVRLVQEKDRGMYDAINRGWEKATGDILSWLNCDEQYLPGTLARATKFFEQHPDVDAVFGDTLIVDREWRPLVARREIPLRATYVRNGFLYALSCSTFFRRRVWDEGVLRLDEKYRYAADLDLILRLLETGRFVAHLDAYLGLFCVHGGNLSVEKAADMEEEVETIRRRHGALPRAFRPAIRLLRVVEKTLNGCYRVDTVSFDAMAGAPPAIRHVGPCRVGWRFTYDKVRTDLHPKRGDTR